MTTCEGPYHTIQQEREGTIPEAVWLVKMVRETFPFQGQYATMDSSMCSACAMAEVATVLASDNVPGVQIKSLRERQPLEPLEVDLDWMADAETDWWRPVEGEDLPDDD